MPPQNHIITKRVIVGAVCSLVVVLIGIGINRYIGYQDRKTADEIAERKYQIEFNVRYMSKMDTLIWLNRIQNDNIQDLADRLTQNEAGDRQVRKAVRKGERVIDDP